MTSTPYANHRPTPTSPATPLVRGHRPEEPGPSRSNPAPAWDTTGDPLLLLLQDESSFRTRAHTEANAFDIAGIDIGRLDSGITLVVDREELRVDRVAHGVTGTLPALLPYPHRIVTGRLVTVRTAMLS